jgi:flavin-dependent dehydrogenase
MFVDGRVLETAIEPAAASIARVDLDAALWHSAVTAGVDARQRTTVRSMHGRGPFVISTTEGDFESRSVINCSGRWSNLRANDHVPQQKWIGLKAHFAEPSPPASVDLYFFEGGYCGVSPVTLNGNREGDRVNVCAMVRSDVASSLPQMFARNRELAQRASNWRPLTDPVSTAPLIFFDPQPERDRVLMAGDAAGFVDPFVGDGISLALRSGTMAAESLRPFLRGEVTLEDAVQSYGNSYRSSLLKVFESSSRIRRLLLLPSVLRKPIVTVLEKTPAVTNYLVRKTR